MSILYIFWIRQLKRYLRSKSRIVGSLGQPLLFLLALGLGFGPIYNKAGEGNYMQFLSPGIISMGIIFMAIFSGVEIIWDREFGFLKETLVAPVPRWKIMFGKVLGGATVAALQGIVIFLLTFLVGFKLASFSALPLALLCMFLVAFLFSAMGMMIGSMMEDMHGFQLISNFLVMPIFFLSGAIFPLQGLPSAIQKVATFNPLSYGVDGLRFAFGGITHFGIFLDLAVLIGVAAIFLAIGSYLFSRIEL